ncbi:MAG: hypothetical protein ABIQ18_19190 [Umezawaea sp.]
MGGEAREPGVYDAAVALLGRRGASVPREVLERDFSQPVAPHPDVEWPR